MIDLHERWAVDGYQTPPRRREQVALRYPVEVFPHGTCPARAADVDHVIPYQRGGQQPGQAGQTSSDNLAPLGRLRDEAKIELIEQVLVEDIRLG